MGNVVGLRGVPPAQKRGVRQVGLARRRRQSLLRRCLSSSAYLERTEHVRELGDILINFKVVSVRLIWVRGIRGTSASIIISEFLKNCGNKFDETKFI